MKKFMLTQRKRHLERRLYSLEERQKHRYDIVQSYVKAEARQRALAAVGTQGLDPNQQADLERHNRALSDPQTVQDRAMHEFMFHELTLTIASVKDDLHEVVCQLDALSR